MSSSDRTIARRLATTATLALALFGLAACADGGIRPLYGKMSGAPEAMRHIDVVTAGERVGQQIVNELDFAFYGGAGQPEKPVRWRLDITPSKSEVAIGLDRRKNLATGYIEQVSVTWILTEVSTGRTVTSGSSFANASYDYSAQQFADVRAQRDAANRAASVVAADIRNRIAVWFAEHPAN